MAGRLLMEGIGLLRACDLDKLTWKKHYGLTDEEMIDLELLIKDFNGKIISVNDVVIKEQSPSRNSNLIKGIGYIENNKKSNKRA